MNRYHVKDPRIFGSVFTGTDTEESDLFFHIWIPIIIVDIIAPNPRRGAQRDLPQVI